LPHCICRLTIFLNGDHIKPFVIISAQSIHSELKEYGFPQTKDKKEQGCDGNHAYVVGSKSAYINSDLFVIYVKNVLIPGVENLRKLHKL